jgi:tetratricopeptide (TPR) repeat protein
MGVIASEHGDLQQAKDLYQEGLTLARETGDRSLLGILLSDLGYVAYLQGDFTQAQALYQESLSLARELGDKSLVAQSLSNLGYIMFLQGNLAQAGAFVEESLPLARELGNMGLLDAALESLGSITLAQGDLARASALFKEGLSLRQVGNKAQTRLHLIGLARVAASQDQPLRAVRLLAAAEAQMDINASLSPADRAAYERTVESLRAKLSESAFAAAWAEGRTTALQDILMAYVEA